MIQKFLSVQPLENYLLEFQLHDCSTKLLDMKPYLDKGIFMELQNWDLFKTVRLDVLEGVEWECKNLSLSKDTILEHLY